MKNRKWKEAQFRLIVFRKDVVLILKLFFASSLALPAPQIGTILQGLIVTKKMQRC